MGRHVHHLRNCMSKHISIPDLKLNFWQLGCIAGAALGLPGMLVGGQLAHQYGAGTALISICTGNLILWLLGMGLISIAKTRNAIENIRNSLGNRTGIAAALMLTIAFIIWYSVQINGASLVVSGFFQNDSLLKIGVGLGLFIAVLGMGGILLIRWVCVVCIPLLVILSFGLIGFSDSDVKWNGTFSLSMSGIFFVILMWLPGILNLPMIFRHAKNKYMAMQGLAVMTLFHMFFQSTMILTGIWDLQTDFWRGNSFYHLLLLCFGMISYVCVNLVNIYWASTGIEMIAPKARGSRDYFVVGLMGTAIFIFVQIFSKQFEIEATMLFLQILAWSFMGNLAIVLSVNLLVKFINHDKSPIIGRVWSNFAWILGCMVTAYVQFHSPSRPEQAFVSGIGAVLIVFIFFGYVYLSVKSYRKLMQG